jgi:hypothetical protein
LKLAVLMFRNAELVTAKQCSRPSWLGRKVRPVRPKALNERCLYLYVLLLTAQMRC